MNQLRLFAAAVLSLLPLGAPVHAQSGQADVASRVMCSSTEGSRQHCDADTSAGVVLVRATGTAACLLGRTWGYDQTGVWVSDGCGGEFIVGHADADSQSAPAQPSEPKKPTKPPVEEWSEWTPGQGFLLGRSDIGELSVSLYALLRYVNQLPPTQSYVDHLGNTRAIDTRNDIFSHRVILWLTGWVGVPNLRYMVIFWTVNTTDQKAIFGNLGYQFGRAFSVYGGINGNPGTRSMQGSHPYWLGHDRVMADEFFRPYFTFGVWAQGEVAPGLWYNTMLGNNSSSLGILATQLDRKLSTASASAWWMPTTHEFGPRGAYGDWEMHDDLATRFGFSTTISPEERHTDSVTGATGNTTIRLADSLNVFDTGALAPGVTVQTVNFRLLSLDAGAKYRGIFLQTEFYTRWLDSFVADGPLPVTSIVDRGFYVQGAFFPWPKKLELYGITSQIFGDKSAGFKDSSEYGVGLNFYPANTRNHRLNVQVMDVNHSPVGSTFGYYVGGQTGTIVSSAFSVFF
jgi:hypothetical protein